MTERRYEVFISSTFEDLQEHRRLASDAILKMGHIPVGMELFPPSDSESLELIKPYIDSADYYLLIVGGRYGSCGPDGISYTEKEYLYAREQGKFVIPLVVENPDALQGLFIEKTDDGKAKLAAFKESLKRHHFRKWNSAAEIPQLVWEGMTNAASTRALPGWIRDRSPTRQDLLEQVSALQRQISELTAKLSAGGAATTSERVRETIAAMQKEFPVVFKKHERGSFTTRQILLSQFFSYVGPSLVTSYNANYIAQFVVDFLQKEYSEEVTSFHNSNIERLFGEYLSLGLIELRLIAMPPDNRPNMHCSASLSPMWQLTQFGAKVLSALGT